MGMRKAADDKKQCFIVLVSQGVERVVDVVGQIPVVNVFKRTNY